MKIISNIQETRNLCQQWRDGNESISFVPTMGCLHEGHLSLIRKAKSIADRVVVSIFVNPLQFEDVNDLTNYPVTLDEDISKLTDLGVDLTFTPSSSEFYSEGESAVDKVEIGELGEILEGEKRPGHFSGVATVVKRLFELIQPRYAVFGEKDFQQLLVIKQLVRQFSLNTEIIAMPTSREKDGLAMSSRNVRLTAEQRKLAPGIFKTLNLIKKQLISQSRDFLLLEKSAMKNLSQLGFEPDYVVIRNAESLDVAKNDKNQLVILIAARLGEIRLIDNLRV